MDNNTKSLKVLVVDDTIVYRKIVGDILSEIPGIEVVGTANNGKIALSKIASLKPDLITLDIEMPEMNGIEVLAHIKKEQLDVGAIIVSTLTHEGGAMTISALELGAFDFIPKPESGTTEENRTAIKEILVPMLKAFRRRQDIKNILKRGALTKIKHVPEKEDNKRIPEQSNLRKEKSEIITIGVSTGGPRALAHILPMIPKDIGVPILIVQHMPPIFTRSLARSLNSKCAIHVKEAEDGEVLKANTIFLAPGGKQMKVSAAADGHSRMVRITDDPPENSCKPSVDYLFRSIAAYYMGRATGIIMTGMGSDGTLGSKLMKENGSVIIAQDEVSCTVFGMPREVINAGHADIVVPIDRIVETVMNTI
jgi:two-component system, chemotaxis family, protein-glutamate methylesterase/glutaminase